MQHLSKKVVDEPRFYMMFAWKFACRGSALHGATSWRHSQVFGDYNVDPNVELALDNRDPESSETVRETVRETWWYPVVFLRGGSCLCWGGPQVLPLSSDDIAAMWSKHEEAV